MEDFNFARVQQDSGKDDRKQTSLRRKAVLQVRQAEESSSKLPCVY